MYSGSFSSNSRHTYKNLYYSIALAAIPFYKIQRQPVAGQNAKRAGRVLHEHTSSLRLIIIITNATSLHLLRISLVFLDMHLDIIDLGSCFFPRSFVTFCPVDMALRKFHLLLLAFIHRHQEPRILQAVWTHHVSSQVIFLLALKSSQVLHNSRARILSILLCNS